MNKLNIKYSPLDKSKKINEYLNNAQTYLKDKNLIQAEQEVEKARFINEDTTYDMLYMLINIYFEDDRYYQAEKEIYKYISNNNYDYRAYLLLGISQLNQLGVDDAINSFRSAKELLLEDISKNNIPIDFYKNDLEYIDYYLGEDEDEKRKIRSLGTL